MLAFILLFRELEGAENERWKRFVQEHHDSF